MRREQQKIQDRSFLLLLIIVTIGFGLLLKPFFYAIFWAALLAILFRPLYRRLDEKYPNSANLTAICTISVSMLIVVIPLSLVTVLLAAEAAMLYQKLSAGEIQFQQWLDNVKDAFPFLAQLTERFGIDFSNLKESLSEAALKSSKVLAAQALSFGQEYIQFAINFVLMIYLMFFFVRDGDYLIKLLIRALPLGDTRERHLFNKFAEVSRATIKGNLVVATVQGTLGGLIFWVLGIQGALLWGCVMVILSLLPAVGSGLVWVPAAIYLIVTGAVIEGIILIAFGMIVIGLVDNMLRPILVGRDTKMPDYMVLISTLGGIILFGLHGFVIGPVIAALFLSFWQIFMEEFNLDESMSADTHQD
ncbi:MAG: AI-2E family transporter [Ketobacteraceae bacterium]|nr:AI-2E family transporter [Ketobacteraceae bacterium]